MRSSNWSGTFIICAILGVLAGYCITLVLKPQLLPPMLRFGGLTTPTTVLLLGTDVVYSKEKRWLKADPNSFQGRSDTIMVCRLDPIRNSITILSIPRDTSVKIPGYRGMQKINGANALGGPRLAAETIWNLLNVPVDHYVVLNVHGLVELVDELGGITVEIPKAMKYRDRSAKLDIDLQPGPHVLNGREAMGFVRFRHDALGDIGRVQRQSLFLKAVQDKAMDPSSWAKLPKLISIAQGYVLTDLDTGQLMQMATFARAVPKENHTMIMMPGNFSGTGDWAVDEAQLPVAVARLLGQPVAPSARDEISVVLKNATSDPQSGQRLYKFLSGRGYRVQVWKSDVYGAPLTTTRIIAQKGNTEDALLIKRDLFDHGDIVAAPLGDYQTAVTILAGDDLANIAAAAEPSSAAQAPRRKRKRTH